MKLTQGFSTEGVLSPDRSVINKKQNLYKNE